jgi:hypothetical protein
VQKHANHRYAKQELQMIFTHQYKYTYSYRWKEPIAYYFTPGSVQGAVLGEIVDEICKEAAKVGLHVLAETNDMGTPNLAAWT